MRHTDDIPYDRDEEDLLAEIDKLEVDARCAIRAGDNELGRHIYSQIVEKRIEHRNKFVKVLVPYDWKCPVCKTRETNLIEPSGWIECVQGHRSH